MRLGCITIALVAIFGTSRGTPFNDNNNKTYTEAVRRTAITPVSSFLQGKLSRAKRSADYKTLANHFRSQYVPHPSVNSLRKLVGGRPHYSPEESFYPEQRHQYDNYEDDELYYTYPAESSHPVEEEHPYYTPYRPRPEQRPERVQQYHRQPLYQEEEITDYSQPAPPILELDEPVYLEEVRDYINAPQEEIQSHPESHYSTGDVEIEVPQSDYLEHNVYASTKDKAPQNYQSQRNVAKHDQQNYLLYRPREELWKPTPPKRDNYDLPPEYVPKKHEHVHRKPVALNIAKNEEIPRVEVHRLKPKEQHTTKSLPKAPLISSDKNLKFSAASPEPSNLAKEGGVEKRSHGFHSPHSSGFSDGVEIGKTGGRLAFQIHGQKGPHSYRFGYDTGKGKNRQFRYEERDNDGEVRGRYGYLDKYGKMQIVNYSAHPKFGFRADVPKY